LLFLMDWGSAVSDLGLLVGRVRFVDETVLFFRAVRVEGD